MMLRSAGSAFDVIRADEAGSWWPAVRASTNLTARATAGLQLLDDARRQRARLGPAHPAGKGAAGADLPLDEDAGGHVRFGLDMPLLGGRYRYVQTLATGTTARVVACDDLFRHRTDRALACRMQHGATGTHPPVVLKVFSSRFFAIGEQESERLRRLNAADPRDEHRLVRQLGRFVLHGRFFVIAMPLMAPLRSPLGVPAPMPLARVRELCAHVLLGLAFLESQGVIHADVKPDNIMLCSPNADGDPLGVVGGGPGFGGGGGGGGGGSGSWRPTLIDMGNACTPEEAEVYEDGALQTLAYRAPETAYGLPLLSYPVDMWSLGCVLAELGSGAPLFGAPTAPAGLVGAWAELLGRPPAAYAEASRWDQLAPRVAAYEAMRPHSAVVLSLSRHVVGAGGADGGGGGRSGALRTSGAHRADDVLSLCDLIAGMLAYEPSRRLTPLQALSHPFVCAFMPFRLLLAAPRPASGQHSVAADADDEHLTVGTAVTHTAATKRWRSEADGKPCAPEDGGKEETAARAVEESSEQRRNNTVCSSANSSRRRRIVHDDDDDE